ncbi:SIR2 family protein [uncultured Neisseria sp.]|uniref:SIR2 family protein n=1 Tax=uncultured Neisseria sp. TaxID=237778 RepID=UPI0025EE313A|nr:SIR2 family protein [uncultured Neisseria sp.]
MKFTQADIDSIITAQENDNLTVFIGAGFSKFSETATIKFPSWGKLMIALKNDLNTQETDFLKIAQLYYLEFGEYKLYQKLREFVPLHAEPSDFHLQVFQLLKPKYVITTNWDNLLEKTVSNNGLFYDVMKTEADLIKSNLPKKLIKVHGSFDTHNIVFKEDDYLNYSINNPIFDNFLKHILSTTTVLFLGYSYSDSNLKQIIKWIEKNSEVSPPRFLLQKENYSSQRKYLENHGIKVLAPVSSSGNYEYKHLYEHFFSAIKNTKGGITLDNNEVSDTDVINYFYKKLVGLAELNCLLPEQITYLFSNCTVEYHQNCFGLYFHSNLLTTDYDPDVRKIYSKFFDIIKTPEKLEQYSDKLNTIFSCFLSARVFFIKNSEMPINIYDLIKDKSNESEDSDCFYDFISFSKSISKTLFNLLTYNSNSINKDETEERELLNKNIELFNQLSSEIIDNMANKRYLSAMISKFNKSIIAKKLANDLNLDNNIRNEFLKEQNYDFTGELIDNNYPPIYRGYIQPLVDLLGFKSIYKFYYDSASDNEEHLNLEENKKNGGFGFTDKEQRSNDRLIQLLNFCAYNDVALDVYTEFQKLMQSYVLGKIKIHEVREKFELTKVDLFILIKYFKFKDLKSVIDKRVLGFVNDEPKEGNGSKFLSFSQDEKDYLADTFKNLSDLFITYGHYFYSNTISNSFLNLIIIIGLVKWESTELDKYLSSIKSIFLKRSVPIDYIRSVNYFILIQYKLYKTTNPRILELVDVILEGFISGKFRKHFYQRINNDLSSVYRYADVTSILYENKKLVKKALFSLDNDFEKNLEMQRYFLERIFLPIYQISNAEIKELFTPYFDKVRISNWNQISKDQLYEEILRELDFLQYGFEVKQEFIDFMTHWIKNDLNKDVFSSLALLKVGGAEELINFIDFLITSRNISQLEKLRGLLKEKIQSIIDSAENTQQTT